ncbi:toxin-antitoxin system YwqK family antitoxin [Buttiauxella noackiae]|uniref:toxin-antitoxin system YwqK family antitoxin n=1 Tax=Buttiauxella noackiae TaxID=82992 RepID=UPI00054D7020|nr:hypothetical protein [Buttiauxella noackiae]
MKNNTFALAFTALLGASFTSGAACATDLGKLVHGPLATNDGQTLAFYQKDNNVTAWFTSPPQTEQETISDYALIVDSHYELGSVSIVAVFYQDLDKGGQDEVIVMYRDASGKPHLRAWGADADQMLPLTRLTPQLEDIAASLEKFTVAGARKALADLLPQQYLITRVIQDPSEPLFRDVLGAPHKYHPVFQRYFDELGDDVTNPQDAQGYSLIFPGKFIERTNEKAEKTKYTLTMDIIRQGSCGMDEAGFSPTGLHYENLTAGKKSVKEGPFVYYTLQGCQLTKNSEGQYHDNHYEGDWTWYSPEEGGRLVEKGTFRKGLREGSWQRFDEQGLRKEGKYLHDVEDGVWQTFAESGEVIALESYQKGYRNGPWWRKVAAKGSESGWVTEEQGQYLNDNKEGAWQERMTHEPRYAHYHNGLLDGELRVTKLNGQNCESGHYQKGLRHGESSEWHDNGELKKRANYLYGQLQGTSYNYRDSGKIAEVQNWKPGSAVNADLCQGLTNQDACDIRAAKLAQSLEEGEWRSFYEDGQLAAISERRNGKRYGTEYEFNHSGKLSFYARWDGKADPLENTRYDYSQLDDYAHKPVRMSLLADTRLLNDGRKEQSTFHSGSNKLSRHNFWCSASWTSAAVCGTEYLWYRSGVLSAVIQQHYNRRIESTDWDSTGFIDRQTVKTSEKTFSERFYILDKLYTDTVSPATTYHDGNEEVVAAGPSNISETRRYDKRGNLVTFEEQQKEYEGNKNSRVKLPVQ